MAGAWSLGGANVEDVLRDRLVGVHALFVLIEHLVLGSHFDDVPGYHRHLVQRSILLTIQEDGHLFSS